MPRIPAVFRALLRFRKPMRSQPITALLEALARGESDADERLASAVGDEFERIAEREMRRQNRGHLDGLTLEPLVFAHDALLRVLESPIAFENRRHFFSYATNIIVRALIDYQRRRRAGKRGGNQLRMSLSAVEAGGPGPVLDLERVPPVLEELDRLDPRKADGVRLRVFWGATADEIAKALDVSRATVERDWSFSRRWMAAQLGASATTDE